MTQSPYSLRFCVVLFNATKKVSFTLVDFHSPNQQSFLPNYLFVNTIRLLINIIAVNGQLAINNALKHSAGHP